MADIGSIEPNGLTVASTFSGGGGSCLGYRLAGFDVRWANEFVPAAQKTYRANFATTILDVRDIRQVRPEEILNALGMAAGDLDVFDGSPPCQSFSMAGKRERGWGKIASHGDGSVQRSDDLFFEYVRLLEGLQPRTFVAENVSGLIKGKAKGYFLRILSRLKECGYRVEARVLDAQWLGVPQQRQRLIFQGVRADLERAPSFPVPFPYRYTVSDAIDDLASGEVEPEAWLRGKAGAVVDRLGPGQSGADVMGKGSYFSMRRLDPKRPAGTVQASEARMPSTNQIHPVERRRVSIAELRRICSFPDDFVLIGSYEEQWARLGNSVPPLMMKAVAATIRDEVLIPAHC